jgi:hypothetical protein
MTTPLRSVRIPDGLWDTASRTALKNGETVSDVIREALRAYIEQHLPPPGP